MINSESKVTAILDLLKCLSRYHKKQDEIIFVKHFT